MNSNQIRIIERLREAAREHGEVHDLLCVLESALDINEQRGIGFVGDSDELEYLRAAILAASFVDYDNGRP